MTLSQGRRYQLPGGPGIFKMNETKIQNALFNDMRSSQALMMPNYTPLGWWECDLFSVTKAGYWAEHEIKVTVADFKNDGKKATDERRSGTWDDEGKKWVPVIHPATNKHDLLAARSEKGPSRFFFVVPEAMQDKIVIPEWAGLKIARDWSGYVKITIIKDAPKLHKKPVDQKVYDHAHGVAYWRYWNIRSDLQKSVERQMKRQVAIQPT